MRKDNIVEREGLSSQETKKAPRPLGALFLACWLEVITDLPVIVVVIIPVAIGVPAVAFHVPPAVVVCPAIFAGFVEFGTTAGGLLALVSVMLNGFVQFVVGVNQSLLAIIGFGARCAAEKHKSGWPARPFRRSDFQFPRMLRCRIFSLLR